MNFLEAMDRFVNHGESVGLCGDIGPHRSDLTYGRDQERVAFLTKDIINGEWYTIEKHNGSTVYRLLKNDIELLNERIKRLESDAVKNWDTKQK